MATITENLQAIRNAKSDIKQAIESKGQNLDNVPFTQYAEKINAIQTGSTLTGTIEITKNGTYNVLNYASAIVNVVGENGETKELIVDLPNSFITADEIYYFNVSEDKILFSCNVVNSGLYEYNINTGENVKLYSGYNWQYFQIIGNKCFISGDATGGLLIYNTDTGTINKIYSEASWGNFQVIGNKCLISSNASNATGILLYDDNAGTITKIYSSGNYWAYFQVIGDKCLIASGSSSNLGILLFDNSTNQITKIWETNYSWQYFQVIGNKCLIGSSRTDSGLLLYDSETNMGVFASSRK